MSGPTRAAKCMLKRLCKYYSEAPVLSWSFPYQEMPSEIRAVTDANRAGELEGLRSTSCGWIYFGDHLLETYSSTQEIVALSTAESEYISITKGAAHALEVRSAMVEFGLTFNVACETDASAWRAIATRRRVGRVRHLDARLLWLQQLCAEGVVQVRARPGEHNEADLGTKMFDLRRMTSLLKGTPFRPPRLELMDCGGDSSRGCRGSKRLPCTNLEREEYMRDERLVLDLCGNGHCDPDGVVGRTVCESHWSDD